ncbi:uncharacterized protein LOC136074090 [Hydra vulgaris]|uniref:Uncharacterized protein LOC136074090 n=1 Tax=Hydra vulgaris TaxID=6087 RepID=A0ABM4B136_HYDVU
MDWVSTLRSLKFKSFDKDFDKGRIIQMHNADWSLRKISKQVGCGKSTVQRVVSRFISRNSISRKSGSGRKQKTTEREDRLIVMEVMKNRRISNTVTRIKKGEEFTSGWQTKKSFINEKNCVKRLKWCGDHLSWTSDQWKRVIWTDESPFVVQYGN